MQKLFKRAAIVAILPLLSASAFAQNNAYDVNSTTTPPTIDGVVSEGEWDGASAAAGGWRVLRDPAGPLAANNDRFRMMWDDTNLYVLYETDLGTYRDDNVREQIRFAYNNINFYFDPDLDGEGNLGTETMPFRTPDGYQIAVNMYLGTYVCESGCSVETNDNSNNALNHGPSGLSSFAGAYSDSTTGNNLGWLGMRGTQIGTVNGPSGGVMELAIPWSDLDAPGLDDNGLDPGLNLNGVIPVEGDQWNFNAGFIGAGPLSVWSWHDNPDGQELFASQPHGVLTFVAGNTELIAEDSFETGGTDYAVGIANLVGQGPTAIGFTGDWLSNGDLSHDVSDTAGLSYPRLASSGGAIVSNTENGLRNGRLLDTTYTDASSGTVFMSFLMQIDDTAGANSYRAFELHDGGLLDGVNREFQLGFHNSDFGTGGFGMRADNDVAFNAELAATRDTNVNLFVLQIDLSTTADSDSITAWMNPPLGGGTPAGGVTVSGFDLTFDRVTLARFAGSSVTWDELRIGDTFAAVTPLAVPPVVDPPIDFPIIGIVFDPDGGVFPEEGLGAFTITWKSELDQEYSIFSSTDLSSWENEIADFLDGAAEETSFTFNHPNPSAPRIFFRVELEETDEE